MIRLPLPPSCIGRLIREDGFTKDIDVRDMEFHIEVHEREGAIAPGPIDPKEAPRIASLRKRAYRLKEIKVIGVYEEIR